MVCETGHGVSAARAAMATAARPIQAPAITVSVVVATYNRAEYLAVALDSLLAQTLPPIEIIVVDDGSNDATGDVVRRYGNAVRYFRQPRNQGKSAALNLGMPHARGSHLWLFDDDDVALPDALEQHIRFLTEHRGIDFTYSAGLDFHGTDDIWQRERWIPDPVPACRTEDFFVRFASGMPVCMNGMLIPKHCFDTVGYFDTALARAQDNEMVLRLARHYSAGCVPVPTYVMRQHPGLRGPDHARHVAARRALVWHQYCRGIYAAAWRQFPLSAYLPHVPGSAIRIEDDRDRVRALVQRGTIMLRRGLVTEALADFQSGLQLIGQAGIPVTALVPLMHEGFNVDPWEWTRRFHLAFTLRRLFSEYGLRVLRSAVFRAMYWAWRRAIRQRRWRDAMRAAMMLGILVLPTL